MQIVNLCTCFFGNCVYVKHFGLAGSLGDNVTIIMKIRMAKAMKQVEMLRNKTHLFHVSDVLSSTKL